MIDPARCDHSRKFLEDPRHPLKWGSQGGFVLVKLEVGSDRVEYPITHCFFCGGSLRSEIPSAEKREEGVCDCIRRFAADSCCPVKEDAEFQEFNVVANDGKRRSSFRMYFCPWCGMRLPKGRRGDAFTQVSDEDRESIRSRIADAKTVQDVLDRLGEPDRIWPARPDDPEERRIYGSRRTLRQLDYDKLSPTVKLIVQEYEDGSISLGFTGHYIGKRKDEKNA